MKRMKDFSKKALLSALAFTVSSAAQASPIDNAAKNPLFSLNELGTQQTLIAHGGEGKCGEGKAKTTESKCGEGKCGEGKKK